MKYVFLFTLLNLLFISFYSPAQNTSHRNIEEGSILNIYDAFGKDSGLTKDLGFSCITRYHGHTILFDAGSNADIFKHNVQALHLDLK